MGDSRKGLNHMTAAGEAAGRTGQDLASNGVSTASRAAWKISSRKQGNVRTWFVEAGVERRRLPTFDERHVSGPVILLQLGNTHIGENVEGSANVVGRTKARYCEQRRRVGELKPDGVDPGFEVRGRFEFIPARGFGRDGE